MSLKLLSETRCFGGKVMKFEHISQYLGGLPAKFSVFLPPKSLDGTNVPTLMYLSGLTCNEDNFIQKGYAQKSAALNNIALIAPDTSPRGSNIDGEDDSYDFGSGAGFYVNATIEPWNKYYNMYDYVNCELLTVFKNSGLNVDLNRLSVFGHSMYYKYIILKYIGYNIYSEYIVRIY